MASTLPLALLGLALADQPEPEKNPTTEAQAQAAQEAWSAYATSATQKIWPIFEKHLRDHPLPAGHYNWNLRLVVDASGKHVKSSLIEAAGHEMADNALILAVVEVGEFGPPPEVWIQSTGEAVFSGLVFTFETGAGPDGVIEVPYEK